jgi:hypothetical protein
MHLARTFFVDDTDLEHFDVTKNETVLDAHEAMQTSILNWGRVLIATAAPSNPQNAFITLYLSPGSQMDHGDMTRMKRSWNYLLWSCYPMVLTHQSST